MYGLNARQWNLKLCYGVALKGLDHVACSRSRSSRGLFSLELACIRTSIELRHEALMAQVHRAMHVTSMLISSPA